MEDIESPFSQNPLSQNPLSQNPPTNVSSSERPANRSISQYFITGEFVIIESPDEPCSKRPATVRIYSATELGQGTTEGKLSGMTKLRGGKIRTENDTKIRTCRIKVYIEQNFGIPGAFVIKNSHKHRFFLESATLHAPSKSDIYFDCRSWVYPFKLTKTERTFFSNTSYLPRNTPVGLKELRNVELITLRGNKTGERKEWERIYDYDCYNDLGNPDKGREHIRPVLGGTQYPYPRRERTGRPPSRADCSYESLPETTSFEIYVPPDERLSLKKQSELISNIIQVTLHFIIPEKDSSGNFQSYEEIREMFSSSTHEELQENRKKQEADRRGNRSQQEISSYNMQLVDKWVMEKFKKISPYGLVTKFNREMEKRKKRQEMEKRAMGILKKVIPKKYFKEITRQCKEDRKKCLVPHIIAEDEGNSDKWAWKNDDEFGRQMLAGINPARIQGLTTSSPSERELLQRLKGMIRDILFQEEDRELLQWLKGMTGHVPIQEKDRELLQRLKGMTRDVPIQEKERELLQRLKGMTGIQEKESELLQWLKGMTGDVPIQEKGLHRSMKEHLIQEDQDDRFFILDHNDYLVPFLSRINTTGVCAYASRTLLFRRKDDTLKPIAIELSCLDSSREKNNNKSYSENENENENKYKPEVYVPPAKDGQTDKTKKAQWQLAKAHVAANDSVYHQLISHWLHTHAVVEPFIIATRRQLSVMHPIHQLLDPHFKDTMHVNALARSILINSGGILEKTLFSGKISMELSSALYRQWKFEEQALPFDLVKRHMAEKVQGDPKHPAGVKLLFEDYPYGKDGLEIWTAVHEWVECFCNSYYENDESVNDDKEIQAWWSEVRNQGHVDQKRGWYELKTRSDLIKALTTLIWIASGLHASVNFGQYAYAAYPPNRPTLCRKFIPKETDELLRDPDEYFLSMLPTRSEMALGVALTYVLSRHTSDEVYLGQRPSSNWTDERILKKFEDFSEALRKIDKDIKERNRDPDNKNRWGPAKIPYKLLYPDTSNYGSTGGITGKGIPNSISI